MLDFKINMESAFLANLRAYKAIMKMCAIQKMSFEEALKVSISRFPDFDRLQMLELRYEMHELYCVQRKKERNAIYDMNQPTGLMAAMLATRQDPEFYPVIFLQAMGRGIRKNGDSV